MGSFISKILAVNWTSFSSCLFSKWAWAIWKVNYLQSYWISTLNVRYQRWKMPEMSKDRYTCVIKDISFTHFIQINKTLVAHTLFLFTILTLTFHNWNLSSKILSFCWQLTMSWKWSLTINKINLCTNYRRLGLGIIWCVSYYGSDSINLLHFT